ncbi:MAG: energy transducer TonB [Firmicutes bacterium]|nr:energy transducer TonB [Bacillota bacterium]
MKNPKLIHITCAVAILIALFFNFNVTDDAEAGGALLEKELNFTSRVWSNTAHAAASGGGAVSLDFRQVDLRDALSALAVQMGRNIILLGDEPGEISFQAQNLTAREAMELLIQKQGLSYVEQGNTIVVGDPGALDANYYNQMILARFETYYVPAEKIKDLIDELAIPQKNIIVEGNPQVVFVQGTVPALEKVSELINNVDTEENSLSVDFKTLQLYLISPERAVELLAKAGIELEKYVALDNKLLVFDREFFNSWEEIQQLAQNFDSLSAREEKVVTFKLKNVFAATAAEKLKKFNFGGEITPLTSDSSKFSKELLVICPPGLETRVRSAVVDIDQEQEIIKVPILSMGSGAGSNDEEEESSSSSSANVHQSIHSRKLLLSELTGVPVSHLHTSRNLSGDSDSPEYVLWAEETTDNILLLRDMVEEMGWGSE